MNHNHKIIKSIEQHMTTQPLSKFFFHPASLSGCYIQCFPAAYKLYHHLSHRLLCHFTKQIVLHRKEGVNIKLVSFFARIRDPIHLQALVFHPCEYRPTLCWWVVILVLCSEFVLGFSYIVTKIWLDSNHLFIEN
jgi:hypothetical protein